MKSRLAASLYVVLVLVLAAFTGTALAGNGNGGGSDHGNGNGQASSSQPSSSQPSSAQPSSATQPSTPAKHEDKHSSSSPSSSASTSSSSTSSTSSSKHGDSKHADKQSSTSPSQPATSGDNSHGVKPSNSTKHDTYAKASSGQTKKYGNGKTAGQIATQAGYPNATLHGPGNSQPHKTMCGGHEVDVHALKNKGSKCGTAAPSTSSKEKKVEHAQKTKKTHTSKSETKTVEQKSTEQKHESSNVAAGSHAHVTICHATGSSSNPYVRISPSASGVFHGHLGHQDGRDIVPPFTYKGQTYSENWDAAHQAIYNAGCSAAQTPAPATVTPAQAPQTPAVPQSATPPAVVTPVAPAPATVTPASQVQATAVTQVPATPAATAAGAVKGASIVLTPKSNRSAVAATAKPKPAGGVLGTTTRLGSTVTSARLPFTGLPLWIFVAVAAGLILLGVSLRRTAGNERI